MHAMRKCCRERKKGLFTHTKRYLNTEFQSMQRLYISIWQGVLMRLESLIIVTRQSRSDAAYLVGRHFLNAVSELKKIGLL